MTGIYKITCLETGEVYIGQSVAIQRRIATHKRELKKNIHYNKHLQRTYNKYGANSFTYEILELCTKDKLNEREKFYIKLFNSYNNGFNQDIGGSDISGENNKMYGVKGKDAPRFIDFILQLDKNGTIINSFESSIEAAKAVNGQTSHILTCLYNWRSRESKEFRATHKGYQWIYEQDYLLIKDKWDFSQKRDKSNFKTIYEIDKGALDGDV